MSRCCFCFNKCAEGSTEDEKKTERLDVFAAEMTPCRFRASYPETIMFSTKQWDINSTDAVRSIITFHNVKSSKLDKI